MRWDKWAAGGAGVASLAFLLAAIESFRVWPAMPVGIAIPFAVVCLFLFVALVGSVAYLTLDLRENLRRGR